MTLKDRVVADVNAFRKAQTMLDHDCPNWYAAMEEHYEHLRVMDELRAGRAVLCMRKGRLTGTMLRLVAGEVVEGYVK